jgi:hypothetical protein
VSEREVNMAVLSHTRYHLYIKWSVTPCAAEHAVDAHVHLPSPAPEEEEEERTQGECQLDQAASCSTVCIEPLVSEH